jgi:hypothetical protein
MKLEEILNNVEDKLMNNLKYDEYVLFGKTGYLTEQRIKRLIQELREELDPSNEE